MFEMIYLHIYIIKIESICLIPLKFKNDLTNVNYFILYFRLSGQGLYERILGKNTGKVGILGARLFMSFPPVKCANVCYLQMNIILYSTEVTKYIIIFIINVH